MKDKQGNFDFKRKNGIPGILFALRTEKRPDGKSAFQTQIGRQPNTLKSRMIERFVLDQDPQIEIGTVGFREDADSTILVRVRVRGTKLMWALKEVKATIVGEPNRTFVC